MPEDKKKVAHVLVEDTSFIPYAQWETLYNDYVKEREEAEGKPLFQGQQWHDDFKKVIEPVNDYYINNSDMTAAQYDEARGNIHNQFTIASRDNYTQVGPDEIEQMIQHSGVGHNPFMIEAQEVKDSGIYDETNITLIQGSEQERKDLLDSVVRSTNYGDDILNMFHSDMYEAFQLNNDEVGEMLNQAKAENVHMLTCDGGTCVDTFNLDKDSTFYRPYTKYQGVNPFAKNKMSMLYGTYKDAITVPQRGAHFDYLLRGEKARGVIGEAGEYIGRAGE